MRHLCLHSLVVTALTCLSIPLYAGNTSFEVDLYAVDSSGVALEGSQTVNYCISETCSGSDPGTCLIDEDESATFEGGVYESTVDLSSLAATPPDALCLWITIDDELLSPLSLGSVIWSRWAEEAGRVASGGISASALATDAVTTTKILDGTIAAADIADSAVTTAKIADSTIAAGDLATDAVTTTKILDGTIAAADIAHDTLDFGNLDDTLDLDAALTLNQTTNAWTQSFTGTTATGLRYTANSLTTGTAVNITAQNQATSSTEIQAIQFGVTNAQATVANTQGVVGVGIAFTNNPSVAGNLEIALGVQNQVTSNTTDNAVDALLYLNNQDTIASGSTVVTNALLIKNTGDIAGGITNAINIDDTDVTTDIVLQNDETIDNDTDGIIKLTGQLIVKVSQGSGQTISNGDTVTANACGTVKRVLATAGVTTNTTDTFTAPSAANDGCCMDVINMSAGNFTITLDANTNFRTIGGADVSLGLHDAVRVCSTGDSAFWYQISAVANNS